MDATTQEFNAHRTPIMLPEQVLRGDVVLQGDVMFTQHTLCYSNQRSQTVTAIASQRLCSFEQGQIFVCPCAFSTFSEGYARSQLALNLEVIRFIASSTLARLLNAEMRK